MKKTFLLIVVCTFAFISAQAQRSEVETATQLTKAEQFKLKNSFIKEAEIYKHSQNGIQMFAKLFTDLKNREQLAALEFHPTKLVKVLSGGQAQPLGYLDMDQVDDLILALETILKESSATDKKDKFSITYTAPGGIDVWFSTEYAGPPFVMFRKKWFTIDDYGVQTSNYSEAYSSLSIKGLPDFISAIKEAQKIAIQSLGK